MFGAGNGAISRTVYAQLFALIGSLYGSGKGASMFDLPAPK